VRRADALRRVAVAVCTSCLALVGPAARAQTAGGDSARSGVPHVLSVNAAAVPPGQFVYATSLAHDTASMQYGSRIVSLVAATYAGAPASLLVETRLSPTDTARDSLFVDPVSLTPLHWVGSIGPAQIAFEFRGDTAYGGTSAPTGRRSAVTIVPPGTLVSAAMLETALRALPLVPGYQDSTNTLSVNLHDETLVPTTLSVIGREMVRVPAGTFDCWVVSVHAGDRGRGLYWVSTDRHVVVRSELDVGGTPGEEYVSTLLSASTP